jgi:hypothetical protein
MRIADWNVELCTNSINKDKITNWEERSKTRPDWEKSINEAKARVGL